MKRKITYSVLISLLLATPFLYSNNMYSGTIVAKQLWFYAAMTLLILIFGFDLFFNRKKGLFKPNIIDIVLLIFYTYFFIRTAVTTYTPLLSNIMFIKYSLLLLFYFIVKHLSAESALSLERSSSLTNNENGEHGIISLSGILVIVLILTGLIEAIWGLLQLYGVLPSFHPGFKITGTFFNPAPYALYLAAIFPLAFGTFLLMKELKSQKIKDPKKLKESPSFSRISQFLHSLISSFLYHFTPSLLINKLIYYISLFTVLSIILVLPATMNRASWLGAVAGTLVVLNYRFNFLKLIKEYLNSTIKRVCAIAIIILLIGLSGFGLYFLKKDSSDGRLLIWEITAGKIVEKPLFGYGVGRFEAEYNNWQAEYFQSNPKEMDGPKGMLAGNTKYCFNEYLEIASELGIIGLILFLAIIVTAFLAIKNERIKELKNECSPHNFLIPSLLIPSLTSLLVCALISFPFYSLPTLIVFFLLIAMFSSYVKEIQKIKRLTEIAFVQNLLRVSLFLMLTIISVSTFSMVWQQYKSYNAFNEAIILYESGNYGEACISFSKIYPKMSYNGDYLQYYGKALNMNEEYTHSIKILERSQLYTSDEILYTTIGETYKIFKKFDAAEKSYKHALLMVPHKLFPQYLLANLYYETGQKRKAFVTAEAVLNKEIKVESTATKEIKEAMRELVEKLRNEGIKEL